MNSPSWPATPTLALMILQSRRWYNLRPGLTILELFHGPTLAFKDVAMQLLARLMDHVLEKRNARATIVGATSGDTGGAAIEAFRYSKRIDITVLFPAGRVSDVQRRMMTTPKEKNVHAVAVRGTFDDCQALVKAMFNDHAFRDRVDLSGVNSINWARIVAQVTYYFYAAVDAWRAQRPLSFAVPTGNFGDIFAGYVAKRMGLPIDKLIIASNENDILPRAVATGAYAMKDVVPTSSPSMDIQISSNFERYLFEASGRDVDLICSSMASLVATGRFELGRLWPRLQADFAAASASEDDVAACIKRNERPFRLCSRSAHGMRRRCCRAHRRQRRNGRARNRPSRQIPRCHRGHHRQRGRRCRTGLPT